MNKEISLTNLHILKKKYFEFFEVHVKLLKIHPLTHLKIKTMERPRVGERVRGVAVADARAGVHLTKGAAGRAGMAAAQEAL